MVAHRRVTPKRSRLREVDFTQRQERQERKKTRDTLSVLIRNTNELTGLLSTLPGPPGFMRGGRPASNDILDPRRDISAECGWPDYPTVETYSQLYEREGIATRCVNVFPDESWTVYPEIYESPDENKETPFEAKWKDIEFKMNPWYFLHRLDVLSGIGRYGIMVMGFDDKRGLDQPISGVSDKGKPRTNKKELNLTFLHAYDEYSTRIIEREQDSSSPRYGMPTMYEVNVVEPTEGTESIFFTEGSGQPGNFLAGQRVHWTRVLHAADNRRASEVFGIPRMKPVLNRIADLRKILGGSAEMFWQGGFPGFALETLPEIADEADIDLESIKDQVFKYINGLQRWMALTGMTAKPLTPQVANPTNHVEQQLRIICATLKVPMRIFMGSEAGHLASQQDEINWNKRVKQRQTNYVNPMLVKPFLNRLIEVGVLPKPKIYTVDWVDLNSMTEKDKADIALKKTQALLQYVTSGSESIVPLREFLIYYMQLPAAQADAFINATKGNKKQFTEKVWNKKQLAQPGPAPSPLRGGNRRPRNALGGGAQGRLPSTSAAP